MLNIFKIFDKYNVLSPRATIHYSRGERRMIKKIIKLINAQIRIKTQKNNSKNGVWFSIEVSTNEILSEKVVKTIIYLISKKRWTESHFETRGKSTTFYFTNPLTCDLCI